MEATSLLDRWEALKSEKVAGEEAPATEPERRKPTLYHPLEEAADDFVRWAQSPHERILLGITELDREMRGIAPGEMCLVIGYSHSGKTLSLLEILRCNRSKRIIYFCPDEPRVLTLIKLTCILHGLRATDLERRVAADDESAIELLRSTAVDHFPHLAVFDQSMSLADMERSYAEVTDLWGAQPELVVFDYLELLSGGGEDVPAKATSLKAWGRRHNVPLLVLHQTSRSTGAAGRKLTISSGAYGGEQQATHIIGVRRKRFEIEAQINDLESRSAASDKVLEQLEGLRYLEKIHAYTVTMSLLKNKRPDASLLPEIDYEIEAGTGRLTKLGEGELPRQYQLELRGVA